METNRKGASRRIFVSSPYRPTAEDEKTRKMQVSSNTHRARVACKFISLLGMVPLAPHLYFTRFLDDNDEESRERGMKLAEDWLAISDEVWAFTGATNSITDGMVREITLANKLGITVRVFMDPEDLVNEYLCYLDDGADNADSADSSEEEEGATAESTKAKEAHDELDVLFEGLFPGVPGMGLMGVLLRDILGSARKEDDGNEK